MKKNTFISQFSFLVSFLLASSSIFSQGTTWNLTGNNNASSSTFVGSTTNQPLSFRTNNVERFRINGNGQFLMFGLGTTGSGFLSTDATGLVQRTSFTGNTNHVLLGNGTFGVLPSSTYFTVSGTNMLTTPYRLGIGVSNPTNMLEVDGDAVFNGDIIAEHVILTDVSFAERSLYFRSDGMYMEGYDPVTGTRNEINTIVAPLFINSKTTYNQHTIFNAGNSGRVGIGTISPTAKFEVNGDVKFTNGTINFSSLMDTTTSEDDVVLVDSLGNLKKGGSLKSLVYAELFDPYECQDKFGGPKQFPNPTWANGLNKIYVRCPQVFVGIGTATPRVNLDVRGTSYSQKVAIGSLNPVNVGAYLHIKTDNSTTAPIQIPILVENQGQKILQLNKDGLLYAREIKVNLDAAWPDYVFEPTYKLRPLAEVKQFIIENKHLPNVPSAKEIEEKGLNLGEGNKILLEKVEEMTLYMIQLEENLKKQEELLKAQADLLKAQQEQILLLQTQNK